MGKGRQARGGGGSFDANSPPNLTRSKSRKNAGTGDPGSGPGLVDVARGGQGGNSTPPKDADPQRGPLRNKRGLKGEGGVDMTPR